VKRLTNEELNAKIAKAEVHEQFYNDPEGWMSKPDFKRKEQTPGYTGGAGFLAKFKKSTFQWRWWVLEEEEDAGSKKARQILRYFKDQNTQTESGNIDMTKVKSMNISVIKDAPQYALDLNTDEKIYTVACDNEDDMIRWAKVFSKLIDGTYSRSPEERENEEHGADPGEEFSVKFETKESLFMSLEGLSTYTIIVTGFVKRPDGTIGQAESSGKIKEDDYLIGVNDVNLETMTFFDSVAEIGQAEWPMTLHFRRTKADEGIHVDHKGWVLLKAPTSDKFYRRFLQLTTTQQGAKELSYFKPAYGGRQSNRAGFFDLSKLTEIKMVHEMAAIEKLEFRISLHGFDEAGEWMMCVRDTNDMETWANQLKQQDTKMESIEVKAATKEQLLAGALHSGYLKKQSDLNSKIFNNRFFILVGKELAYRKSPEGRRLGGIDLAQVVSLTPQRVEGAEEGTQHRLVLSAKIDDSMQTLTMVTGEEAQIAAWKEKIEASLGHLGDSATINSLETVQATAETAKENEDDDEDEADMADETRDRKATFSQFSSSMAKTQGWMYKKGDVGSLGIRNSTFRKRYFVLNQAELCYYKTKAQVEEGTPTGVVALRRVIEVRESQTTWAENGIDLVTKNRVYTVVPETDEETNVWLDALQEAVDIIDDNVDSLLPPDEDAAQEKLRDEIKASLQKHGEMTKLTGNRLTGIPSWKARYFALAGPVLSYYEKEEDIYNEESDALGTLNMHQVTKVQSSNHPDVEWSMAMNVVCGERTYVFQCQSEDQCTEWMVCIAAGTGKLKMEKRADGTWCSVNPKAELSSRMSTYGKNAASRAKTGRRSVAKRGSVGRGGKRKSLAAKKRASLAANKPMDITSLPEATPETPTEETAPAAADE